MRIRNLDEISNYLSGLERLVVKMKLDKLWDREKQDLTENLLVELSENWHEFGRDDISKAFKDFLERIRTHKRTK